MDVSKKIVVAARLFVSSFIQGIGMDIVMLSSCDYYSIRLHENLVQRQHPCNNISIFVEDFSSLQQGPHSTNFFLLFVH